MNQYITTLLLLQEDEEGAGGLGTGQEEMQPLCPADALERVLQIIPILHSTSELTESLCAAIFKVCVRRGTNQKMVIFSTHKLFFMNEIMRLFQFHSEPEQRQLN